MDKTISYSVLVGRGQYFMGDIFEEVGCLVAFVV